MNAGCNRCERIGLFFFLGAQTIASETCRDLELAVTEKTLALGSALAEVHEESRKAAEAMRQAVAGKAGLSDLEVYIKKCLRMVSVFAREGGVGGLNSCHA